MFAVSDELLTAIKLRVRKTRSNALDEDLKQYAAAAIQDLYRIGVIDEYLKDCSDPLIREAILTYCNANYGNPADSEKLNKAYDIICAKLKGGEYVCNSATALH